MVTHEVGKGHAHRRAEIGRLGSRAPGLSFTRDLAPGFRYSAGDLQRGNFAARPDFQRSREGSYIADVRPVVDGAVQFDDRPVKV